MAQTMSKHAMKRIRQRGYRDDDVKTELELGSLRGDAVFLSDTIVREKVIEYRHMITQLERLRGTAVIVMNDTVVTIYRPAKAKLRRMT